MRIAVGRVATIALTLFLSGPGFSQPASTGGYVEAGNGHLYRDGVRLRLWGANLQSGVFKSYAEIDQLVYRLKALGFNAIRLWPTPGTFYSVGANGEVSRNVSRKGDGTDLDRFDYLVARATASGLNLQMTMLHYIELPVLRAIGGTTSPAAPWIKGAATDSQLRLIHGFAPYLSDEYRALLESHMDFVLNRTNPYTGRRYSSEPGVSGWELANEARFVDCSLSDSCYSALPLIAREQLSAKWKQSPLNADKTPLPMDFSAFLKSDRYPAFARFIAETFISNSTLLRDKSKKLAGPASGFIRQPVIFNTGPIVTSAVAHYAYSQGDIFSIGSYRSPLVKTGGLQNGPWSPYTISGGTPSYLSYTKIADKPMIVYETSFFRPYEFRAEWGPLMAAIALQQDWDGAFLYQYGHPSVIYDIKDGKTAYGTKALPEPSALSPSAWQRDYTYGFHHGGDPATIGSWAAAGRLVIESQETVEPSTTWEIPLSDLYSKQSGYPAYYFDLGQSASRNGAVATRFVPDGARKCTPCTRTVSPPSTFSVSWPTVSQKFLSISSKGGAGVVGLLPTIPFYVGDTFLVRSSAAVFGSVFIVRDESTASESSAWYTYVNGAVSNANAEIWRDLMNFDSPYGALFGVTRQGSAPLTYSGAQISLSAKRPWKVEVQNFDLQKSGATTGSELILIPSDKSFRARLTQ